MAIPAEVHFCWIGRDLPWAYAFGVLSAAARGGMDRVTLHHTDDLVENGAVASLRSAPGVWLRRVDALALLAETGASIGVGQALRALHDRLETPVLRSDLLRAAILYREGGLYLDLDTVTARSLRPLLDVAVLLGTERIVWPAGARSSRSLVRQARHLSLDLARKLCRLVPSGWRLFRRIEPLCVTAANNAAMGAELGSAFLATYLRAMLDVDRAGARSPYAFGPHLLQAIVGRASDPAPTLAVPAVFSPLPPEISEHWFRAARAGALGAILRDDTRVVHWYASVRTRPLVEQITPDYVRAHRSRQPYSMLVHSCLPALPTTH